MTERRFYIGLMSGTSLDGVDGVLAEFSGKNQIQSTAYLPFPTSLRNELMSLQTSGDDEIHREAMAANALVECYAACVQQLLQQANLTPNVVRAIGAHGQTIRHRPELGYTRQINNPALLAELTGINVIADFRSRDIAAGGQGAPLVPAFHQAMFGKINQTRVIINIGGISNVSILHADGDNVTGFDTGPGNVLMDAWIARHQGHAYDKNGAWGASGTVIPELLQKLKADDFFKLPPPKSTGRDLFNIAWLDAQLASFATTVRPVDVQATLTAFTAATLADAIYAHAPQAQAIYVCGGGAYNDYLLQTLSAMTKKAATSTETLGIAPQHVEALAFAWLAQRHIDAQAGNLPAVTGARGPRILGALYPA